MKKCKRCGKKHPELVKLAGWKGRGTPWHTFWKVFKVAVPKPQRTTNKVVV